MKSIFEIITILIFLFIVTLFQKMDESYCDSTYYPTIAMPPCKPAAIVVSASYKKTALMPNLQNIRLIPYIRIKCLRKITFSVFGLTKLKGGSLLTTRLLRAAKTQIQF